MKKQAIVSSVILMGSVVSEVYKSIYDYGKEIIYRDHFYEVGLDRPYRSVQIKNNKGLTLQGYLIEKENANQTLVMLHGYNESSRELIEYIPFFEKLLPDCNILLVDLVAHGNSDGYIRGLAWNDIIDLVYWNRYLIKKYGEEHSIIMYGKGIGANIILNAAGLNKLSQVKAIISEGAFTSVYDYFGYTFGNNKVTMKIASPIIRRAIIDELDIDIKKIDTRKLIKNNKIPTIFVHSQKDRDVYFQSVMELYNNNSSEKDLFPIKTMYLYDTNLKDDYSLVLKLFIAQYA